MLVDKYNVEALQDIQKALLALQQEHNIPLLETQIESMNVSIQQFTYKTSQENKHEIRHMLLQLEDEITDWDYIHSHPNIGHDTDTCPAGHPQDEEDESDEEPYEDEEEEEEEDQEEGAQIIIH